MNQEELNGHINLEVNDDCPDYIYYQVWFSDTVAQAVSPYVKENMEVLTPAGAPATDDNVVGRVYGDYVANNAVTRALLEGIADPEIHSGMTDELNYKANLISALAELWD